MSAFYASSWGEARKASRSRVQLAFLIGTVATFAWWRGADQAG